MWRFQPSSRIQTVGIALLTFVLLATPALAQRTQELQHLWEVDPPLGDVWTMIFAPAPVDVAIEDLNSPLIETRLNVAEQIQQHHKNPNLGDKQVILTALFAKLKSGEEQLQVRRAMLTAALSLSDATRASTLWELAQTDPLSRSIVERALIQWQSPVVKQVWQERIKNAETVSSDLLLALEGLAAVGAAEDAPDLERLLVDQALTPAMKFHVVRALGQMVTEGRNDLAQQMLESNADRKHLLAAHILSRHSGPRTVEQLKRIIDEGSQAAQVVAYSNLAKVDHPAAFAYAKDMLGRNDNQLRRVAVEVINKITTPDNLTLQALALKDRHPEIRQQVSKNLLQAAAAGERSTVDRIVTEYLSSDEWTAVEQSIMLSVRLQDTSRCDKLLELLDHPRPEVNMRAGWGLMELGNEPDVLARMQQHVEKMTELLYAGGAHELPDLIRISHLCEGFGKNLYRPANDLMLKYVAKDNFRLGVVSRASAIWALGKLNSKADNPELRKRLHERIRDTFPPLPEDYLVRFICLIACGEMAHLDSEGVVRECMGVTQDPLNVAAKWAMEQIRENNPTK